ncbi:MAG: PIG-L family deacetylase [Bacteroidia bacterium]
MKRVFLFILLAFPCLALFSQADWYHHNWSESRINLEIDKVLNPTKVLYVAAHPDDENTRLISWMVNNLHAEVAYLSLTNGSGGQNLIGEEIGEDLGLIREQELLAARRIDGASQFFTRATDFGYSKSWEETFEKWGRDKTLEQMVYRIRKFKPDIIITRFSPNTDGLRRTHGHHTASAILAVEAYKAAADPNRYPHQLAEVEVWEADAIYWNTSYWSYGSRELMDSVVNANPEFYVTIDVDEDVSERGMTSSEIAAASRSMHKSQGFGTMTRYGENKEYLQLLRGKARAREKLHASYVKLSSYSHQYLEQAKQRKDKSELILQGMEQAKKDGKLSSEQYRKLQQIWLKSIGLRVFVTAEESLIQKGENEIQIQLIHYGESNIILQDAYVSHSFQNIQTQIKPGENFTHKFIAYIDEEYTTPEVKLTIDGIELSLPLIYRTSDPVKGEIIQPVFAVNLAMVDFKNPDLIIIEGQEQPKLVFEITPVYPIKHLTIGLDGAKKPLLDKEVDLSPNQTYRFEVEQNISEGIKFILNSQHDINRKITVTFNKKWTINKFVSVIKHEHIPWIYKVSENKLTAHLVSVECTAEKVGYVMGAGDRVPEAMRAMGVEVVLLDYKTVKLSELKEFDAVVFGIRALNVLDEIDAHIQKFYDYAKSGGTLIMQYNTSHRLKTRQIGLETDEILLSRGRVTQEDQLMSGTGEGKDFMKGVNTINSEDYDSWVQERGLYFPSQWTNDYKAPFSMADAGEEQLLGSLIYRKCGDGYFIYTGISFFRHLPAGVRGSYKIWANLISMGVED